MLLCTAFSALHGLLGAWLVPAMASGPVFEVCTPQGVQWVLMDDTESSRLGGQGTPDPLPQGLAKPCVWAAALHGAPPATARGHVALAPQERGSLHLGSGREFITADTMRRVLLMAPMRAPPA